MLGNFSLVLSPDVFLAFSKASFGMSLNGPGMICAQTVWEKLFRQMHGVQGSHRLEQYLNIQDSLEKSLKIKLALKST